MTREEMMNNVIKKYGFEAKETINFCHKIEWLTKEYEEGNEMTTAWLMLFERYKKLMRK